MTYFRTCSSRRTRSQAPLCVYTRRVVSNHAEGTFARLRYFLGGDRPSQTTHQAVSVATLQPPTLGIQEDQGGISTSTPPMLAHRLRSLPPILHRSTRIPLPSYSKGAQGLSVFLQVCCVFTANSISLSLRLRQWGCRYAIRAGRNLPDKEFRYLRTVIVTAAVYRGFGSELRQVTLTNKSP